MRIAIAGTGPLALNMLRSLLESRHEVVALIQNGRKTRGLARSLTTSVSAVFSSQSSVTGLAVHNRLPVLWINRMNDRDLAPLRALEPDVILVGAFSIILKKPILDLPRIGCINTHSSLLPKHRGPNPFAAVILANEPESGVTFHVVDEGIDTGDILEQFTLPIGPTDTAMTIYYSSAKLAGKHIVDLMDCVEAEGLHGTPQDETQASYDKNITAEGAYIDWQRPAADIDRHCRAYKAMHLPRFRYRGRTIFVSRLKCNEEPTDAAPGTVIVARPYVKVATGEGTVTIVIAYATKPIPWVWPMPWNRPKPGELLE